MTTSVCSNLDLVNGPRLITSVSILVYYTEIDGSFRNPPVKFVFRFQGQVQLNCSLKSGFYTTGFYLL